MTNDPTAVARTLTAFLVESPNHYSKSPVEERVRAEITRIANELAIEVINANEQVREVIRARVQSTIAAALRDDSYLSEVVVQAVARGLGRIVADSER